MFVKKFYHSPVYINVQSSVYFMYHNRKVERTYESGNKDDDDDDYYCVKLDE